MEKTRRTLEKGLKGPAKVIQFLKKEGFRRVILKPFCIRVLYPGFVSGVLEIILSALSSCFNGDPTGNRTPVSGVRGQRPNR